MYTYVVVHTQRSEDNRGCWSSTSTLFKHGLFFLLCMLDYLGYNLPEDSPVSVSNRAVGALGLDVHTMLPVLCKF